ncbi:MAG TPA: hypothetical protein VK866_11175 [Acidimicrobiales bacterium]|nr:hypothetical protein [Acidimicrobiales bacterium]
MSGRTGAVVGAVVAVVVLVGAVIGLVVVLGGDDGRTVEFVVEAGTGNRLAAGEDIEIMPEEVLLEVGDEIRIVNEDSRAYLVGPYFVRAGETVAQRFDRPQELVGACDLSGGGEIRIVVTGRGA